MSLRDWSRRTQGVATIVLTLSVATISCGGPANTPTSSTSASKAGPASSAGGTAAEVALKTRATISSVAGRVGPTKRERVKDVVAGIVDTYLDGAFVAGDYPREDFSTAFADFRDGAAAEAVADVDRLTNHDIGAQVASVTATHRRVRIDVLAPGGQPSAATARFVLTFETTGQVAMTQKVVGSLFLTNQQGAWTVFGYDVRQQADS